MCTLSTLCTKNDVNMWYKQQTQGTLYGFDTQSVPITTSWTHNNVTDLRGVVSKPGMIQSCPMTVPAHWPCNAPYTVQGRNAWVGGRENATAADNISVPFKRFPWSPFLELRTISPLLNALCEGEYVLPLHLMTSPLQIEIEQYRGVNTSVVNSWADHGEQVAGANAGQNRTMYSLYTGAVTCTNNAVDLTTIHTMTTDRQGVYLLWEEYAVDVPPQAIPSSMMVQLYEVETFISRATEDDHVDPLYPYPMRQWNFQQDLYSVSNRVLDRIYLRIKSMHTDNDVPTLLNPKEEHVAKFYPRTYSIDSFDDNPGNFCIQLYHNQRPVYPGAGITSRSQLFQMATELLGNQYTLPTNYIHCPEGQGFQGTIEQLNSVNAGGIDAWMAQLPAIVPANGNYDLNTGARSHVACSRTTFGAMQPWMQPDIVHWDDLAGVAHKYGWARDATYTTGNIGMCSGPIVLPLGRLFNDPIHTLSLSFKAQGPFVRMNGTNQFQRDNLERPIDPKWLTFECIMLTNQIIQFDHKSGEFSFMRVRPEAGNMNPVGDSGKPQPDAPQLTTNPIQQSTDVKS
jgi:hypothetical protein